MNVLKYFLMFTILCNTFIGMAESRASDEKVTDSNAKGATEVESYWKAAVLGNESAVERLSAVYNRWNRASSYDWSIPEKYLQAAADARFKGQKKEAREYDSCFIIVATEDAIIQKLGIKPLLKKYMIFYGGDRRCQSALENLGKKFYMEGRSGTFCARAENYGSPLGNVLVVDRKTALEQFRFTTPPITDWVVYVKSPNNPQTLIPFYDFHRYVYEEKMKAFTELCCNLGAEKASVHYSKSDKESSFQNYQVDGTSVMTFQGAQNQTTINTAKSHEEKAELFMKFTGSRVIRETSNAWLDSEPTWRALQNNRRNPLNPQTEMTALFHYTDDYMVNVETKTAFESAEIKLGSSTKHEFKTFSAIIWRFHVKFPPALMCLPWWMRAVQ